jgi:hypothetical protein
LKRGDFLSIGGGLFFTSPRLRGEVGSHRKMRSG